MTISCLIFNDVFVNVNDSTFDDFVDSLVNHSNCDTSVLSSNKREFSNAWIVTWRVNGNLVAMRTILKEV